MTLKRFGAMTAVGVAVVSLGLKCTEPPNVPEKPWGPDFAMKGVAYSCSTKTTHPDGKQVEYQFDWGDGSQSAWSGLKDGGTPHGDTHTYNQEGPMSIKARARASGSGETEWSEPLNIVASIGEGQVRKWFTYTDPEDPEDSASFSLNTFGIGDEGLYIGCEYGRMLARDSSGSRRWEFPFWDFDDEFETGVAIADDGTAYIGCINDTFYAVDPSGTMKWSRDMMGAVYATAAIGADGAVFTQSEGGVFCCFGPGGEQRWIDTLNAGGKSSPVIGTDGTVYACTQEGFVVAFDPSTGTLKGEKFQVSGQAINASPALDPDLSMLYVVDEDGKLVAIELPDMVVEKWAEQVGFDASSIVIGGNGRLYVSGGGRVYALDANSGSILWQTPDELYQGGTASTPAVSESGYVYVLFSSGKKDLQGDEDTLYGLNPDLTRRWATALGEGVTDDVFSSPKIDDKGFIYIGSGYRAWVIGGIGGPARSPWPMFQRDVRSTGRAR
ncbi:MAG: PQQ-like beta-propeller repeat protein [candidate division WOR-3 bacterium]|nr:MAG: PQQ-like beta-propeller repeat protein [candidate division WOR-3 bacterium]